jgi:hypothetical protein
MATIPLSDNHANRLSQPGQTTSLRSLLGPGGQVPAGIGAGSASNQPVRTLDPMLVRETVQGLEHFHVA